MTMQSSNFTELVTTIEQTDIYFLKQVQKQINTALTLRNWLVGLYIIEYEQHGTDRAEYGEKLYKKIAAKLQNQGVKGLQERNLYLCKDFYRAYPNILQSATAKSYIIDFQSNEHFQSIDSSALFKKVLSDKLAISLPTEQFCTDPNILINYLSFTHIVELIKADIPLKRYFYETEAIINSWAVRDLQRAMNSMLYERTGLSTDKKAVLEKQRMSTPLTPQETFRNPYILEFLRLQEKAEYTESDLEQAIIDHLQLFLMEAGRGFCFEHRQKRITFDNTHYYIDLVFYHRILKCHVLVDLKLGEFMHTDAGQMNMYLNYFSDNEMEADDNPPVGIILCAGKNENLVKYATANLPQPIFVSKYLINLPKEDDLMKIIDAEQYNKGLSS